MKKIYKIKGTEIRRVFFYDEERHEKVNLYCIIAQVKDALERQMILKDNNQKYTKADLEKWVVIIPDEYEWYKTEIIEFNTLKEAKEFAMK